MRRMQDRLQVDNCDSMIRERHELGPTSMNVNISIYTSPNLKRTIEARNEGVVRTFRVQPFGPDTTRYKQRTSTKAKSKHRNKRKRGFENT